MLTFMSLICHFLYFLKIDSQNNFIVIYSHEISHSDVAIFSMDRKFLT